MSESVESPIVVLARAVGLEIDPDRVPTLEADYAAARGMIDDLRGVETELVPPVAFDPAWPSEEGDRT